MHLFERSFYMRKYGIWLLENFLKKISWVKGHGCPLITVSLYPVSSNTLYFYKFLHLFESLSCHSHICDLVSVMVTINIKKEYIDMKQHNQQQIQGGMCPPSPNHLQKLHTQLRYFNRAFNHSNKAVIVFMRQL